MIKQGRSFSGHERNCVFWNTGHERFATVSAISGLDFADDGRCVATVDWDQDGDLDVWLTNRNAPRLRFMRNEARPSGHFLLLRLVGNGETTNRDAIGARIEVVLDSVASGRNMKTLRAGEGFLSQSSKWVHFGLGNAREIDKVIVHWPAGAAEEFTGLQVDGRYELQQASGHARILETPRRRLALRASEPELPPASRVARVPLITALPMPKISYTSMDGTTMDGGTMDGGTMDGGTHSLEFGGRSVLLNLWSSSCPACGKELEDFSRRETELRRAGIDVLAISVDKLSSNRSDLAEVAATLRRVRFPFAAGFADQRLVDDLQDLHNSAFSLWRPLPIPCSFLIDRQGKVRMIYKGPTTVDDVLSDAGRMSDSRWTTDYRFRHEKAACLPGRALDHELLIASSQEADIRTRYRAAMGYRAKGRMAEATKQFLDLVQHHPKCGEAHSQLAIIYLQSEAYAKAARHSQLALQLNPDSASQHNTMGNILAGQQKQSLAEFHYARAIQIDPTYAQAHNNLGTIHASKGDFATAARHFQRTIQLEPDSAEAHNNLGSIFAVTGDLRKAIAHYEAAVIADPEYAEAYNNLGSIFARRGKLAIAVRHYQRALKLNPRYREARDNLRRAQAELRKSQ